KVSDPPDFALLLSEQTEGRNKRTRAKRDDQFAAGVHSITFVACTRIDCGILMPRFRAVFLFNTKSNLVGCSTGRSAGFAPLSILSVRMAARRTMFGRFAP